MVWYVCLILSLLVFLLSIQYAFMVVRNYKSGQLLNTFYTVFIGVFVAVGIGLIPIFYEMLQGHSAFVLKLIMTDLLQTLQVFTINVEADFIFENIVATATPISEVYTAYLSILFFLAPLLTFGFLISLFKNLISLINYACHYWSDVYVFSELSEKSLCLAESIKKNHPKAVIVFTDVDKDEGDVVSEFVESAKELKAIMFQKDIVTVNFRRHSKSSNITFFAIGEDESENLIYSLKLISMYENRENTSLYVFSSSLEGEIVFSNCNPPKLKIRRVNEIRSLVYSYLYNEGNSIFETAVENGDKKIITAVILGLGQYGTEMIKALTWFGQMDGYEINIHAFDNDENAGDKFAGVCPEIVSPKYNGVYVEGEGRYNVVVHSGVDVATGTFASEMEKIPGVSFVFVCLGSDRENINQAANVRMLCERYGSKPIIKLVVYSAEESSVLTGITNYRGQEYGIDPIGDRETSYSEEVIMGSEIEKLALERHLKWGKEEEFWLYEYNYRSSMASAIHMHARIGCGIAGADKKESDLTDEERLNLELLEHRRWNVYMRSEGYVYSGSKDKESRNDLAKTHHNLVEYKYLSDEDKRKDSSVGSK